MNRLAFQLAMAGFVFSGSTSVRQEEHKKTSSLSLKKHKKLCENI